MTAQLDPWELNPEATPDQVPVTDDWDLGPACSLDSDDCEACQ